MAKAKNNWHISSSAGIGVPSSGNYTFLPQKEAETRPFIAPIKNRRQVQLVTRADRTQPLPILRHHASGCLAHLQLIKISTAVIQSQLPLLPPPELIPNVTIILLQRKLVLSFSPVESAGRPRYCWNAFMPTLGREVLEERKIEFTLWVRFFRWFRECKLQAAVWLSNGTVIIT